MESLKEVITSEKLNDNGKQEQRKEIKLPDNLRSEQLKFLVEFEAKF